MRRVSLVAERASPVRLAFGSGNVVIEAQTEGRARAVETVPAEFAGDERVISFNPHYLLDGLTAAASPGARDARPGSRTPTASTVRRRRAGQQRAGSHPEPGLVRIEFTSPAKPALITRAAAAEGGAGPEPGTAPVPSSVTWWCRCAPSPGPEHDRACGSQPPGQPPGAQRRDGPGWGLSAGQAPGAPAGGQARDANRLRSRQSA